MFVPGAHNRSVMSCILLWGCPLLDLELESVVATQEFLPLVLQRDLDCLWLRGLLPRSLVAVDPQDSMVALYGVGVPPVVFPSGWCFTDSSVGQYGTCELLRRYSFGIARLVGLQLMWGVYGAVPGVAQSVPRGELFAILVVLSCAAAGAFLHIVTDSKVSVYMFNRGAEGPLGQLGQQ